MAKETNIIIGTTAINRPQLHSDNIRAWIDWISLLDMAKYRIHWFINIDIIDSLESTYDETKSNFEKINNGTFSITFLRSQETTGNFLRACQRIATSIERYVSKLGSGSGEEAIVIWLEDDWKLNGAVALSIGEIIETYSSGLSCINLSFIRNNYIHALAPSIIRYELWKTLHLEAWTAQTEHTDPEHCVGRLASKLYGDIINIHNLTVITRFKRVNRSWVQKQPFLNNPNSYYTYHSDQEDKGADNFIRKSECKGFFEDKVLFVRITCGFCADYGRNFMNSQNLAKKRLQNDSNIPFYSNTKYQS